VTVRIAVLDPVPRVAEIVAVVFDFTEAALTVNVAEVFPAGIVTVDGTAAADTLLDNVITKPPVGAAELIVTVPLLDLPRATDTGLNTRDLRVGEVTVKVPVFEVVPSLPVTIAAVLA
jgi:hypothetical protein